MSAKAFKTNLSLFRWEAKLSQQKLCDKLEIPIKRYQAWEEGRSQPDIDTLELLADFYTISLDELMTRNLVKIN